MSRPSQIWFRKATGWWMVTLAGRQVQLAAGRANRKAAEQKFHELKLVTPQAPDAANARVCDIIESFLKVSRLRLSAETMRNYDWYGQAFAERWGYLAAGDLAPHHVTTFVTEKGWTGTTEYNARRSLFRVFSWAAEERVLQVNPLRGMKRPNPAPRGRAMTDDEFRRLLRAERNPRFRSFLYALRTTGCRPKEARVLVWD